MLISTVTGFSSQSHQELAKSVVAGGERCSGKTLIVSSRRWDEEWVFVVVMIVMRRGIIIKLSLILPIAANDLASSWNGPSLHVFVSVEFSYIDVSFEGRKLLLPY